MKTRTFRAKSYSEALLLVKEKLGPDAVIISSQTIDTAGQGDGAPPIVELTAASSVEAATLLHEMATPRKASPKSESHGAMSAKAQCSETIRPFLRRLLEQEVRERLVEEIVDVVDERLHGLPDGHGTTVLNAVLKELSSHVRLLAEERRYVPSNVMCVVGTPGTGKTTLSAKLAAIAALKKQKSIGLVALSEKGGMGPLLRMTGSVLNCPVREAGSPEALTRVLAELSQCDRIFMDTSGINPFDDSAIARLANTLTAAPGVEIHLVLRASARDVDNYKAIDAFSGLGLTALAFSMLDEACCYGGIINAGERSRLPLSFFGFGREIPADLELASRERILDLLLDLSSQSSVLNSKSL